MPLNLIFTLSLIFIFSLTLSWLVQLGYYLYCKQKDPKAFTGQKTLLDYYTGYIGDGIIVPLINTLIYILILNSSFRPSFLTILSAIAIGLGLDILAHYVQGRFKLVNWSMPRPFNWNFAGKWHMISFPIQMGYMALSVFAFWESRGLVFVARTLYLPLLGIVLLCALFFAMFAKDYDWI